MKKQDAREIVDGQTGEIVAHAIGLIAALRKCDRLDMAYGAIRYYQRPATGKTKMLLNKHNLSIANLAPKEGSKSYNERYNMHVIRVDKAGTAVTNGHYAVMVSLPTTAKDADFPAAIPGFTPAKGKTEPFLLHLDDAASIRKAIPKKPGIPILQHACVGVDAAGQVALAVTDLASSQVFTAYKPEGRFPKLESSVPTEEPLLTICLSADYLQKLAKAAMDFNAGDTRDMVKLKLYGATKVATMETTNGEGQKFFAMLMPVSDY